VMKNLTELKMQPTIHYLNIVRVYPALLGKCIVGCIFNSFTKNILQPHTNNLSVSSGLLIIIRLINYVLKLS
jgi:hypothetical protein